MNAKAIASQISICFPPVIAKGEILFPQSVDKSEMFHLIMLGDLLTGGAEPVSFIVHRVDWEQETSFILASLLITQSRTEIGSSFMHLPSFISIF